MEVKDIDQPQWPPQFTLKRHPRARHVKLKASANHGLEIVVPTRFSIKHLPDILETNKSWIIKKLLEFKFVAPLVGADVLPDSISLCGGSGVWKVSYINGSHKRLRLVVRPHSELVLFGDIENKTACKKLLIEWIKEQAAQLLINRLQSLSMKTGLSYNRIVIRGQKSRWGSCTSSKNISLNYKLIFLPENLFDHIIIHELCHTVHMNHSARFWRLVAKFDAKWKEHCREIRTTTQWMPAWIE
jgi:predicted metal-dependent hydrolase